jgi:endonuclease/exonuclease/phosphatase family metal-dependent hydrolase
MAKYSEAEWSKIEAHLDGNEAAFGLPERRDDSVVLGSFNIRDFGDKDKRSDGAWRMLTRICARFDLIAIQEVEADLESLFHLRDRLPAAYELVYSDTTGALPSEISGISPHERLAFLYRTDRVRRGDLCSDLTFDRSYLYRSLFEQRDSLSTSMDSYAKELKRHQDGERKTKPSLRFEHFLGFIRQPHCVSFTVPGDGGAEPYAFVAVNAHLLYAGGHKGERKREFEALVQWLFDWAKKVDTMAVKNIILFGDLNLDFTKPETQRPKLEARMREFNEKQLSSDSPAEFNFPFIDSLPSTGEVVRTNARLKETFDQIGILRHDRRLPGHNLNGLAGSAAGQGFDFGAVNFVELLAQALHGKDHDTHVAGLSKSERRAFYARFEHDLSDHLPLWIRLRRPFVGQPEN